MYPSGKIQLHPARARRDRHAFQQVLSTTCRALGSKWEPDSKDSVVIIQVKTCRGDLEPTPEIQS
jgi:hypothetical protein